VVFSQATWPTVVMDLFH